MSDYCYRRWRLSATPPRFIAPVSSQSIAFPSGMRASLFHARACGRRAGAQRRLDARTLSHRRPGESRGVPRRTSFMGEPRRIDLAAGPDSPGSSNLLLRTCPRLRLGRRIGCMGDLTGRPASWPLETFSGDSRRAGVAKGHMEGGRTRPGSIVVSAVTLAEHTSLSLLLRSSSLRSRFGAIHDFNSMHSLHSPFTVSFMPAPALPWAWPRPCV